MRALGTLLLASCLLALGCARASAQDAAPAASSEGTPQLMTFELNAGLGVGTRSYERPNGPQLQELEATPFTAVDLSLRVKRCTADCPTAPYAVEFLLRYQTSLGMQVEQPQPFALPSEVEARSSRLELSLGPVFGLGGSSGFRPAIAVPIGASLRALKAPHRDLPLPSYMLLGPHLRVEGRAELGERFALRLGPELQWLAWASDRLQDDGTESSGFAIGLEAAASAFKPKGQADAATAAAAAESHAKDDEIAALKAQLAQLQTKIDKLS